jgi:hypothetical protein
MKASEWLVRKMRFGYDQMKSNFAGIAQLVEQRIRNAKVVGSIPISGTNNRHYFRLLPSVVDI